MHSVQLKLTYIRIYINLWRRLIRQPDELPRIEQSNIHLARLLHPTERSRSLGVVAILNRLQLTENLLRKHLGSEWFRFFRYAP